MYCIDIHPVGKESDSICRDAFGLSALDHLVRDAGDSPEGAGEELFEAERKGMNGTVRGEQAEVECGIDLKVLYVEPRGSAGGLRNEECKRRAKEGRLDGEDDVGLPEALAKHDRQASEHEGTEVRHAIEASRFCRDVERSAIDDGFTGASFSGVELAAVIFAYAPCRVVRGCRNDSDLMAS